MLKFSITYDEMKKKKKICTNVDVSIEENIYSNIKGLQVFTGRLFAQGSALYLFFTLIFHKLLKTRFFEIVIFFKLIYL